MFNAQRMLVVLLMGLAAIALQGTLLKSLLPEYLMPNLILIIVVFLGLHEVSIFGLLLVFALGLLLDLSSGVLLGPWSGAFVVVFLLLALLAQHIFLDSLLTIVLGVFFASLVSDVIYLILIYKFQPATQQVASSSLLGALTTVLAGPPLFGALRRLIPDRSHSGSTLR